MLNKFKKTLQIKKEKKAQTKKVISNIEIEDTKPRDELKQGSCGPPQICLACLTCGPCLAAANCATCLACTGLTDCATIIGLLGLFKVFQNATS